MKYCYSKATCKIYGGPHIDWSMLHKQVSKHVWLVVTQERIFCYFLCLRGWRGVIIINYNSLFISLLYWSHMANLFWKSWSLVCCGQVFPGFLQTILQRISKIKVWSQDISLHVFKIMVKRYNLDYQYFGKIIYGLAKFKLNFAGLTVLFFHWLCASCSLVFCTIRCLEGV